jgi:hypothetical protein
MSITVICAAPGTGLTRVGSRVASQAALKVFDIEQELLTGLATEDRTIVRKHVSSAASNLDMAAFMSSFPRHKALQLWSDAARRVLMEAGRHQESVVLCHLTLFRPDRTEYVSTLAQFLSIINDLDSPVGRVIQLIDDVYDMYAELGAESGALNFHVRLKNWESFTERATPKPAWKRFNGEGDGEKEHLSLEARVQAINMLVSWRRTESIAAESLARSLDCQLVVLGVKHPFALLENVLKVEKVRRVYISHPISAYRREMNSLIRKNGTSPSESDWNPAVAECNAIPLLLSENPELIAIMPTAIDELRFAPLLESADRLTERSLVLGPRWPLMANGNDLILNEALDADGSPARVTYDAAQRSEILLESASPIDRLAFSGELVRFLEGLMFAEIPYRDHLIVANTDAFLVHRPRADRARTSSGVKQEVAHWWDRVESGEAHIRMTFLHTAEDLQLLSSLWQGTASWMENNRQRRTAVRAALEGVGRSAKAYIAEQYSLDVEEAETVWSGKPLDIDQLGGPTHLATETQVARARAAAAVEGVTAFIKSELTLSLHGSKRHSDNVHVFVVEEGIKLTRRRMDPVRQFLASVDGATIMGYTLIGDEECETFANPLESKTLQKLLLGQDRFQDNVQTLCLDFVEQLEAREEDLRSAIDA